MLNFYVLILQRIFMVGGFGVFLILYNYSILVFSSIYHNNNKKNYLLQQIEQKHRPGTTEHFSFLSTVVVFNLLIRFYSTIWECAPRENNTKVYCV